MQFLKSNLHADQNLFRADYCGYLYGTEKPPSAVITSCVPAAKITLAVLITLSTIINCYSQKEADLVSKFRTALKGCAFEGAEPPMTFIGSFKAGEIRFKGVMYYHKPKTRMDMTFENMIFKTIANDSMRWDYNPALDDHSITRISPEEWKRQNDIDITYDFASKDLLEYKSRKHELKYRGKKKLDSLEVHVLELTLNRAKKPKVTYYLNTKNHLLYKVQGAEGNRYYMNYWEDQKYVYPLHSFNDFPGNELELKLDQVIIDKPIADSTFAIPQIAFERTTAKELKITTLQKRGDSLYYAGKYESALGIYTELIKMGIQRTEIYNSRGMAKIALKKYYEAISDFNESITIDSGNFRAVNNRGLAKFYLGDNAGAVADYNEALQMDSTFVTGYKNRGLIFLRASKYQEAEKDFSSAIRHAKDDGEAHFKYGVAIAQLGRHQEAIASYEKAILLEFSTAELYNYRGVSEYKLGDFEKATASFTIATEQDQTNLQYVHNLGNAFYNNKDTKKALVQFDKYLKVKSDNPEIYNMMGLCKFEDENYKGAIKDFTKSIELNGKTAIYYDNRAAAKEMLEDYEGAILDYSKSISVYPNDASVFYKRGLVKIRTSKKLEGCTDLGTANEMKFEKAKDAILEHCH